jgi:hypothetical protein
VERFIRYLRESFWVPLSSRLAQEGLIVDRETANLAVRRWVREVANTRIHGTTGAIPAERLSSERLQLQPVSTPYGGRTVRVLQAPPKPAPIIGLQHPLSLYDAFAGGVRWAICSISAWPSLCGAATSLTQLVLYRVLQGVCGFEHGGCNQRMSH